MKRSGQQKKWVLVYIDTYSFDEPAIVSDPMPYEKALRALNKAREQEGPNGFDHGRVSNVVEILWRRSPSIGIWT